jgi:uncharacterized membrane protein
MHYHYILLAIHIACAAVWFGNSLTNPGRLRRSIQAGGSEAKFAVEDGNRSIRISFIFGIVTFLTGILLIIDLGGFGQIPKPIHYAMLIVMVMIALDLIVRSIWVKMSKVLADGAQPESLNSFKGKLGMFSGIQQLLWVVVLYLMVSNF